MEGSVVCANFFGVFLYLFIKCLVNRQEFAFRNTLTPDNSRALRTADVLTRTQQEAYAFQYSFTLLSVSMLMQQVEEGKYEIISSTMNIVGGAINLIVLTDYFGLRLIPYHVQKRLAASDKENPPKGEKPPSLTTG